MKEQTLILIKPDGVARGLIGEILNRFEKVGLKVVAAKMIKPDMKLAGRHYPDDRPELWEGIGKKSIDNALSLGIDPLKIYKTNDTKKIGKMVRKWLLEYITSGPVAAFVIEGPSAVSLVRKICGNTLPFAAEPGTIRGDYSFDSSALANPSRRAVKNLIHASGNKEEAEYEINLWFSKNEIVSYKRVEEDIMM